jgi:hypothetical protein
MNASAISTMDPATAPIAIPAFAPVESRPLLFFGDVDWVAVLEVVGLDIGVLNGVFDCVFDIAVDGGADGAVTTKVATPRCNDHVVAV